MAYRAGPMSIDRVVLAFAGTLVLISLALSQIHSPYWLWLTAFVGANMLQSAFTGFRRAPRPGVQLRSGAGRKSAERCLSKGKTGYRLNTGH